jgi:glycosyl hydrolase family 10
MGKLNVDAAYTSIVANQFSTVTPENVMKWDSIEPTQGQLNFGPADQLVSFARQHGQLVRGHTLLWHNQMPSWLTAGVGNGTISNDQLRDILKQHIFAEVGHFKGKIWQWDVANEVFANSWDPHPLADGINGDDFWVSHLGEGIIADAFRWAHQADPNALLFYNDFNIAGEDGTNAKADAVYAWAKSVQAPGRADQRHRRAGPPGHPVRLQRCHDAIRPVPLRQPRDSRSPSPRLTCVPLWRPRTACRPRPTSCRSSPSRSSSTRSSRRASRCAVASPSRSGAWTTPTRGCRGSSPVRVRDAL